MNWFTRLFGETAKRDLTQTEIVEAARECIQLLNDARTWGQAKGFDAGWMKKSPQYGRIKRIGSSINRRAGMSGMQTVAQVVHDNYREGYLISHFWSGIGDWRA